VRGDLGEDAVLLAQVADVEIGEPARVDALPGLHQVYGDEPVRIGEGKRPQEDRLDDAEDARVDADAQPDAEDRGHGDALAASQHPGGEAQVLQQDLHALDIRRRAGKVPGALPCR